MAYPVFLGKEEAVVLASREMGGLAEFSIAA
jgi:hypothetical protein